MVLEGELKVLAAARVRRWGEKVETQTHRL